MDVQINLAIDQGKDVIANYQSVKLLFVRGLNEEPDVDGSAKEWALFIATDPESSCSNMLEIYSLRWGIEVYFQGGRTTS